MDKGFNALWFIAGMTKKIRTVKHAQAQRGERVNGSYPYGLPG